tara:strand:- start:4080 stop:4601 length:522 start_codon:yes stop_codon:yes gene_type:complete
MDTFIKKSENIDLSGEDIKNIVEHKLNLFSYHSLDRINSVEELIGEHKACIILYETKENFGHWVALFEIAPNTLEFFDSYGMKMDEELNYAKYNHTPYLSNIVNNSNYSVLMNQTQLQVFKQDINTCGRWTALRLRMKNTKLKDFITLFTKNQMYNGDFWVSALTFIYTIEKI